MRSEPPTLCSCWDILSAELRLSNSLEIFPYRTSRFKVYAIYIEDRQDMTLPEVGCYYALYGGHCTPAVHRRVAHALKAFCLTNLLPV